ncbi:MAG: replisome organizer [Bacteriophage sp.]|jgi:predicted phage replisome organizer|nr:MAG: replisome organizer [Bacteriophage sp.]
MGEVKWVKMSIDMFDNRKIKYLRGLPEGNNIVLIWVMLLTLAGRCNSNGYIFLTENIPYTPAMLANELGFPESTILVAMKALESMGMISRNEENTLLIPGWEEHQNVAALEQIRASNRKRQARYREQAKIEAVEQETPPPVEEKQEEHKEPEEPKPSKKAEETREAKILFERLWSLYPNKKGKGQVSDTAKKKLLKIGHEELERAIQRYKTELEKEDWRKTQYGSTFFNSGYVDYLDANYEPGKRETTKQQKENKFNNFNQRDYDFAALEQALTGG